MRLLLIAATALAVSACDAIESETPLFTGSAAGPKPGLWALLDSACSVPSTAAVQTWAECASPFWVGEGRLTVLTPAPQRPAFLIAEGSPAIVQLSGLDYGRAPEPAPYSYMALRADGPAPFTSARVWGGGCSQGDMPRESFMDGTCRAKTPEAVRDALKAMVEQGPGARAVWIAPG